MVLQDLANDGAVLAAALHLLAVLASGWLGLASGWLGLGVPAAEEGHRSPHVAEVLEELLGEFRSLQLSAADEPPSCPAPAPAALPEANGGWGLLVLTTAGATCLATGFALGWCWRRRRQVPCGARRTPQRNGGGVLQ